MYNQQTIGTCSICGGAVTAPAIWMGVIPPTPTCSRCGAHAALNYGPVIPMVPCQPWPSRPNTATPLPYWTGQPNSTVPAPEPWVTYWCTSNPDQASPHA